MRVLIVMILLCFVPATFAAKGKFKDDQMIREMGNAVWEGWNKREPKAFLSHFFDDATFLSPFGRLASGQEEITKLLHEEFTTFYKEAQVSPGNLSIQFMSRTVALMDQDIEISNVKTPDGKPVEPLRQHVAMMLVKKEGKWAVKAMRPYAFSLPPGELPADKM